MAQAEAYRDLVEARAGGACEYCRLLQAATGVTFHIEHLLPRSRGGRTVLSNLALSCPDCNLAKGERTTGQDESGRAQALFNPRHYEPSRIGCWVINPCLRRAGRGLPGGWSLAESLAKHGRGCASRRPGSG